MQRLCSSSIYAIQSLLSDGTLELACVADDEDSEGRFSAKEPVPELTASSPFGAIACH